MIDKEWLLAQLDGYERVVQMVGADDDAMQMLEFFEVLPPEFLAINLLIAAREVAVRREETGDGPGYLARALRLEM